MPIATEQTWDDLTPAERARLRLDHADVLDRHRAAPRCGFDLVQAAAYERREATAELAGSPEAAAIVRDHGTAG